MIIKLQADPLSEIFNMKDIICQNKVKTTIIVHIKVMHIRMYNVKIFIITLFIEDIALMN